MIQSVSAWATEQQAAWTSNSWKENHREMLKPYPWLKPFLSCLGPILPLHRGSYSKPHQWWWDANIVPYSDFSHVRRIHIFSFFHLSGEYVIEGLCTRKSQQKFQFQTPSHWRRPRMRLWRTTWVSSTTRRITGLTTTTPSTNSRRVASTRTMISRDQKISLKDLQKMIYRSFHTWKGLLSLPLIKQSKITMFPPQPLEVDERGFFTKMRKRIKRWRRTYKKVRSYWSMFRWQYIFQIFHQQNIQFFWIT